MGEIRPDVAEMAGKVTVSRQSANSSHKIYPMDVNGPASMQKGGKKFWNYL
jgi:hypothetical protein